MSLNALRKIQEATDTFFRELESVGDGYLADKTGAAFFEADRTGEAGVNGVIPVATVMRAVQLTITRVVTRDIPLRWLAFARTLLAAQVTKLAAGLATKAAIKQMPVAGDLMNAIGAIAADIERRNIEQGMERDIRARFKAMRDELIRTKLAQAKSPRRVKDVHSRHYTKRKVRDRRWTSR